MMGFQRLNFVLFLTVILDFKNTIYEAAMVGQSCNNSIPCDSEHSSCDPSTRRCTCDYGDYAASLDKCCIKQTPVFSRVGNNAAFTFTVTTAGARMYRFYAPDEVAKLQVNYNKNPPEITKVARVTFTGDATTGDIRFTYNNIQREDAGVCRWRNANDLTSQQKCVTLYVLGTPTTPTITVLPQHPDKEGSVTLACRGSASTTQPTDHGLDFIYTWTFDGETNPANDRYSYSSSRHQLNISNVASNDAIKQFTCESTEIVTDGLTSASSSTARFNVYYGPENIRLTPSTTPIEQNVGTQFTSVTCTADCSPPCTYEWTKLGNTVQNGETLNLGTLASTHAGVYKCTATNLDRNTKPDYTATTDLTVNVVYGPRNVGLLPPAPSYRREVGSTLSSITCQSDCYPCTYSWTGPNLSSSVNHLELGTLSKSQDGTYTCTARNTKTQSTASTTVTVKVMYGPETPTLSPTTTVYTVDEGDTLPNVQCTAACFPTCTYTWTKAGQPAAISASGTFPLGTIQKSYAGVYTCTATNQDRSGRPTSRAQITINVRYGPDSVSCTPSQTNYTQNEGTTVSDITCVSDCYPDCTYTWTKSDTTGTVDSDGTLSLTQLTRSEAGTYSVTAVNRNRTNSPQRQWSVTFNVRYGPDTSNINHQPSYTVLEGTSPDNLICSSDCYPGCSNVWRKIPSNSNVGSNGVISLVNVPRSFAGDYRCTSSNTGFSNTVQASTKLIVNYAPDVTVQLSSQDWIENNTLRVTCGAVGVPSDYNYSPIRQTFGGVSIPSSNSNPTPYNVMTIASLQLQDTGTYTCMVNNGITDTTGNIDQQATKYIKVEVKPKVLDTSLRFVGAARNHVNISIPFYSFPTATNMDIKQQDGTTVVNDNRHHVRYQPETVTTMFYGVEVSFEGHAAELTITNLQEEDFKTYLLVITNAMGTTETTFTLEAESIPLRPKSFVFNGLENGKPSFLWEKDFNGGHTQYFTIKIGSSKDSADFSEKLRVYENTTQNILSNGTFSASIGELSPGTYYAELSTGNKIGDIPDDMALTLTFVIPEPEDKNPDNPLALIIGAVVGGVAFALIAVVAFLIFIKLRRSKGKNPSSKLNGNAAEEYGEDDGDGDGMKDNPMYDTSGPIPGASNNDVYAQVNKKKEEPKDIYAMVDKTKKTKQGNEASSLLYAMPVKSKGKGNKNDAKKGEKKKKGQTKGKTDKKAVGDVYENAPESAFSAAKPEENLYDSAEVPQPMPAPKRNVNQDGLLYAELDLPTNPGSQKSPPVIHGLDDMTEYSEVDFTKKAEPLPDSDEEDANAKK